MKRLLIGVAFFFSISLFFFQSSSYTIAGLENAGSVSFVSEDHALIAIRYDEIPRFWITNNTDKAIYIEQLNIPGAFDYAIDYFDPYIPPGASGEFTITGDAASVIGNTLYITARWDGGEAEISSVLPSFVIEEAPAIVPVPPASPIEENIEEQDKEINTKTEEKSSDIKEQPDTQLENSQTGSLTDKEITSPVEVPSNTNEED